VDVVRNGLGQGVDEGRGSHCVGAIRDFDIGELRRAVYCDVKVEFACSCADFRQVDMEVADWIALERLPGWLFAIHFRQTADPVSLQAAMEG